MEKVRWGKVIKAMYKTQIKSETNESNWVSSWWHNHILKKNLFPETLKHIPSGFTPYGEKTCSWENCLTSVLGVQNIQGKLETSYYNRKQGFYLRIWDIDKRTQEPTWRDSFS